MVYKVYYTELNSFILMQFVCCIIGIRSETFFFNAYGYFKTRIISL